MPSITVADLARSAQLFHALSDETRLSVIELLRGGERCVCELTAELDAAQSRLSFHLKVLKDAGLVHDRPDGRWTYYTLCHETLSEADSALDDLRQRAPGRPRAKKCC